MNGYHILVIVILIPLVFLIIWLKLTPVVNEITNLDSNEKKKFRQEKIGIKKRVKRYIRNLNCENAYWKYKKVFSKGEFPDKKQEREYYLKLRECVKMYEDHEDMKEILSRSEVPDIEIQEYLIQYIYLKLLGRLKYCFKVFKNSLAGLVVLEAVICCGLFINSRLDASPVLSYTPKNLAVVVTVQILFTYLFLCLNAGRSNSTENPIFEERVLLHINSVIANKETEEVAAKALGLETRYVYEYTEKYGGRNGKFNVRKKKKYRG